MLNARVSSVLQDTSRSSAAVPNTKRAAATKGSRPVLRDVSNQQMNAQPVDRKRKERATTHDGATKKPRLDSIQTRTRVEQSRTTRPRTQQQIRPEVAQPKEQKSQPKEQIEDIDADDCNAIQFVSEYVNDIVRYLKSKEVGDQHSPTYLSNHKVLNESMRTVIVNWMVDVHMEFVTLVETLFLSVWIMDRYFERNTDVPKSKFQLVGLASMFVACKFEETFVAHIQDYVYIADDVYSAQDIYDMENEILGVIDWRLSISTPIHFLRRFNKAGQSDSRLHTLCKYFAELTLTEYSMLAYRPSLIAASSVYVARKMVGKEPQWGPTLVHYTGYEEEELRPCAKSIITILKKEAEKYSKAPDGSKCGSITKKYSSTRYFSVAPVALSRVSRSIASRN